ncbi:type III secretion system stator protein SctL [Halomonas sp. SpR8]|uniref:type III secretion system stator protein SctL n=1 Tax=Halomonas sp. SpR8 TaxID=3050463 RepID=UPI0027E59B90|nr:type III secretion system stator protein SctL [Halomonas sp. SpR8]MDQ7729753.1 type III secretion system stator protein SctL [Halomonas sp. SpR8]
MNELPPYPGKTILKAAEAAAWIDGYAFLEQVRRQADGIADEARRTSEKAYLEGFEEGRQAGETQAAELLTRTTQHVKTYLAGLDQSMADLCLQMVRRILGEFDDAELIGYCVRQALDEYRHDMAVTVRVAPDMVAQVEAILAERDGSLDCHVEGDAQLDARQCLLVSPVAVVDVGVDAQLKVLREALFDHDAGRT